MSTVLQKAYELGANRVLGFLRHRPSLVSLWQLSSDFASRDSEGLCSRAV